MITAADADASPEICARRRAFPSPDEVVNGVEADQSHDDQIDRRDEAQQPQHDQDQDAGEEGDERRDVGNGEGVPVGNSRSDILVVQSAQNWHGQRLTDSLDGTRDRRVLLQ
jgi:hypothetical protein